MSELKTPLYDSHVALGGKIVPFAGYLLPVTYKSSSLLIEHQAVRQQAGLFDVSHMGSFYLVGVDAFVNLQQLLSNDFSSLEDGQVRYALMLNQEGGVIDDLIVYQFNREKYLLVVNAANRQKDWQWLTSHLKGQCHLEDQSEQTAILALQGPEATNILQELVEATDIPTGYYRFNEQVKLAETVVMISQTGYTGEMGYELYVPAEAAITIWHQLLEVGGKFGLIPCGLGARDTLRLEAGMPLYGHEMTDSISPLETGLNFAVKLTKEAFIGKAALIEKGQPTVKRVGLKVIGKGIVREGAQLYLDNQLVGQSTSGTYSPTLEYPIAMALIDVKASELGTVLEAEVRGRRISVEVVSPVFYQRKK